MKKMIHGIVILFIAVVSCQSAFAQMDNLVNLSSEWIRTGARNAACDASDIVFYNPAAITKLSNGLHVNVSNQSLFRNPTHSYDLGLGQGEKTYTQQGSDPFLPNIYETYKQNNWAFFTGLFITGGGATMNYPNGSLTTDLIALQALMSTGGAYADASKQHIKASSVYVNTTLGGTYMFSNKLSVALAARYLHAKNTTDAGFTLTASPFDLPDQELNLQTEETASGFSGVVSVNATPTERLNVSVRYESKVKLDFRTRSIKDDLGMAGNGQMNRRDLPAVLALGTSYAINTKLTGYADLNYYFQKNADWGKSTPLTAEVNWSTLAGDAVSYGLGFQYKASHKFTASLGGGYTNYMYADKVGYYTKPGTYEVIQDDNFNVNAGCAYKISERVTFNLGYMHTSWKKNQEINSLNAQPLDVDVKVNSSLHALALGIDLTF